MCKMIQFTEMFCFQGVMSKNFFNLGLDVRWLEGFFSPFLATGLNDVVKVRSSKTPIRHRGTFCQRIGGKNMRTSGWVLLLLSFVIGIITARSIAYFFLSTKPVEVVQQRPTIKILVAQKEIPLGTEITAEYVVFKDVPVDEIPEQAIADFMQVYRRKPAYPLIKDCPICEDLLLQRSAAGNTAEYFPAGSQIVSLEIGNLRVGNSVVEADKPLTQFITAGAKVDIHCVPKQAETGEFVRMKNLVLDKYYSMDNTETGSEDRKIVLRNVAVHQVNAKEVVSGGRKIQSISLLLENGQAEKLAAASREGRLRVIPHQIEQAKQSVETYAETAMTAELQTEILEPETQELPARDVSFQAVLKQPIRLLDSAANAAAIPQPKVAEVKIPIANNVIERDVIKQDDASENRAAVSFAASKNPAMKENEIRNDASASLSFSGPATSVVQTASLTSAPAKVSEAKTVEVQKGVEIGLPAIRQGTYSPFMRSAEKELQENLPEPLPLNPKSR